MIDVSKIQEKTKLAKELVQSGIASNIEDAYRQIENQNLVKDNSEVKLEKDEVIEEDIDDSNKILRKVEFLEKELKRIAGYLDEYKDKNDSNLKELDQKMIDINRKLASQPAKIAEEPKQEQIQETTETQETIPEPETKDKEEQQSSNTDELNPDDFSVDKIFSNSNNQMNDRMKK